MNKHVGKLSREANDARKMIDESESGDSEDSDGDGNENKAAGNGSAKKSNAPTAAAGEKPTEEQVEKLEEKLEAAQGDQKNLFLIIFQVSFISQASSRLLRQLTCFAMVSFQPRWIG